MSPSTCPIYSRLPLVPYAPVGDWATAWAETDDVSAEDREREREYHAHLDLLAHLEAETVEAVGEADEAEREPDFDWGDV